MAGYSGTPLIKKLGVKEGFRVGLVNAPKSFLGLLGKLPDDVVIDTRLKPPLDLVMLFAESQKTLQMKFPVVAEKIKANGMIWVAWPKKSSGVPTDLIFDFVQHTGLDCGLVDVKICAIDDTWSGLKFVRRLRDRPKRSV